MNILILGKGGREHALAWLLSKDSRVTRIVCSPGNGGTANTPKTENQKDWDASELKQYDLVIPGSETYLEEGVGTYCHKHSIKCFGPTAEAAQIETSKQWSKEFMKKHYLPTANYVTIYNTTNPLYIRSVLDQFKKVPVVKASGLMGGKGVFLPETKEKAFEVVKRLLENQKAVVIEERLEGREISLLAFSDGKTVRCLPPVHDYKRLLNGDKGPNTGGMGAYSPAMDQFTIEQWKSIGETVVKSAVSAMRKNNNPFVGCLYAGLMIDKENNVKILEFNARFGDPEMQCLTTLMPDFPWLDYMLASCNGRLHELPEIVMPQHMAMTVMASDKKYPDSCSKGEELSENLSEKGCLTFVGGVDENWKVTGGRLYSRNYVGSTLDTIRNRAYAKPWSRNVHYREDIGLLDK